MSLCKRLSHARVHLDTSRALLQMGQSSSNRTRRAPHSAFMMILAASEDRRPGSSKSSGLRRWSSIAGVATCRSDSGFTFARSQYTSTHWRKKPNMLYLIARTGFPVFTSLRPSMSSRSGLMCSRRFWASAGVTFTGNWPQPR